MYRSFKVIENHLKSLNHFALWIERGTACRVEVTKVVRFYSHFLGASVSKTKQAGGEGRVQRLGGRAADNFEIIGISGRSTI